MNAFSGQWTTTTFTWINNQNQQPWKLLYVVIFCLSAVKPVPQHNCSSQWGFIHRICNTGRKKDPFNIILIYRLCFIVISGLSTKPGIWYFLHLDLDHWGTSTDSTFRGHRQWRWLWVRWVSKNYRLCIGRTKPVMKAKAVTQDLCKRCKDGAWRYTTVYWE